jgi:hypothetical protein
MTKATATRIQQIRTVAIPVIDHDRALDFYVGKLGFEKRLNATFGPGMRWVEVGPPLLPITRIRRNPIM